MLKDHPMSGTRLRPQPGEQWRTYDMTPFGPGAINSLAEITKVVQDRHGQSIVRYQYIYPIRAEEVDEMLLHVFVDSRVAPHESETDWMQRKSTGPDEEPTK